MGGRESGSEHDEACSNWKCPDDAYEKSGIAMDICVTLPKKFGLKKWMAEGDAPGTPDTGTLYYWSVASRPKKLEVGDRVYVVYDGRLIGYSILVSIGVRVRGEDPIGRSQYLLWRRGGAVACTIPQHIFGFQGYRYRFWNRSEEKALLWDGYKFTRKGSSATHLYSLGSGAL